MSFRTFIFSGRLYSVTGSLFLFVALGCTQKEESDTIAALQSALTNMVQNKSLSEQFVRDIKSDVSATDEKYAQAMESYQDARDLYNRFLDEAEAEPSTKTSRGLHRASSLDVQNAAADFLQDATRALKPSLTTRSSTFQRAIVVPEDLQTTLNKVPKKARERLIDQFDSQVRWRSWSKM